MPPPPTLFSPSLNNHYGIATMSLSFHKSINIHRPTYGLPSTTMGGCLRLQSVHVYFNLFSIQLVRI